MWPKRGSCWRTMGIGPECSACCGESIVSGGSEESLPASDHVFCGSRWAVPFSSVSTTLPRGCSTRTSQSNRIQNTRVMWNNSLSTAKAWCVFVFRTRLA
uniref:(northern house mosquito) hypothetical protein n=1 Tax=Culex pipiens TaxID=7175 RepID=A0A8D8CUA2_CULPI